MSALRTYIYNAFIREGKAPTAARMAASLRLPLVRVRRGTVEEAEAAFARIGLTGEFWRLAG
jgi:hypothetical protein